MVDRRRDYGRPALSSGQQGEEHPADIAIVANIIKEIAGRVGGCQHLPGHSLRSGFLTSAASKGASIFKMMDVSRHSRLKHFEATSEILPRDGTV